MIKIIKNTVKYFIIDWISLNLDDKYTGEERQLRIKKSVIWIYHFMRYTFTTVDIS